jgi:hypothetical protein
MGLHRPELPTSCAISKSFLSLEVAFVITLGLKREGV